MLHYGVYCGPGPSDPWGLAPVDDVDRVCQSHDQQYRMCLDDVNNLGVSSSFALPTSMSQIVAVRGWLPKPLSHILYQTFPHYVQCVHRADESFVQGLQQVEKEGLVPSWWAHTDKAPGTYFPYFPLLIIIYPYFRDKKYHHGRAILTKHQVTPL